MKVTQNLKLPQYTEDDVFDLTVINEAHNKIDTAYKEIDTTYKEIANLREEIPKVNANAEIIDARGGQTTLGDKIRNIDSQLDTKASKNEIFTMANMGQDVKEAMTGGSVAVVGKNTILADNIVDNQVTIDKTSFVEHSKNLFD